MLWLILVPGPFLLHASRCDPKAVFPGPAGGSEGHDVSGAAGPHWEVELCQEPSVWPKRSQKRLALGADASLMPGLGNREPSKIPNSIPS